MLLLVLCGLFTSTNPITSDADTDEPFVTPTNKYDGGVSSERDQAALGTVMFHSASPSQSLGISGYPQLSPCLCSESCVLLLSQQQLLYVDAEDISEMGPGAGRARAMQLTSSLTV